MQNPFKNPHLKPAVNPDTQEAFWLGHVGQGVEDTQPMSDRHQAEMFHLISTGELQPTETRYVYAVGQRLTIFDRTHEL